MTEPENVVERLVARKMAEWYGDPIETETVADPEGLATLPLAEWPQRAVDALAQGLHAAIVEVVTRAVQEYVLLDQVLPPGSLERHRERTHEVQTLRRGLPRGLDAD